MVDCLLHLMSDNLCLLVSLLGMLLEAFVRRRMRDLWWTHMLN